MHQPEVPGESAWLRECKSTLFTPEVPHVGVLHVVVDQGCALQECLVANGAICSKEQALEARLLLALGGHNRHAELPIGLAGQAFEALVVFAARDRRLGFFRCVSSSHLACALRCLDHPTNRRMVRPHRGLHCLRFISRAWDIGATRANNSGYFLLLGTECGGLRSVDFGALLSQRLDNLSRGFALFRLFVEEAFKKVRQVFEVLVALDWVDKLGLCSSAK